MRIGLFLNNLDEDYQLSVYKGIKNEAAALKVELICVQGESLPPKTQVPAQADSLPILFPSRNIIGADGILFLSSVLFSKKNDDYADQLEKMFKNIPFVSVGDNFYDYPSIIITTEKPMWELMEHLISFHKYKNFLFIGGPAEHPDSMLREKIFRAAIEKYRPSNPLLRETVRNGNFLEMSGMEIVRDFINSNPNDPPDVIVAANDSMAIGARNILATREDTRWRNCPVTGFDDISQTGFEAPPLTTIRQPLDELGKLALHTLYDIIQGRDVPKTSVAEAKLIIRNSCGCPLISSAKSKQMAAYRDMYHLRYISTLSKSMASINTFEELFSPWSFFLTNLDITLFFLIVYDRPRFDIGREGRLIFERASGKEIFGFRDASTINIKDFIGDLGAQNGTSGNWCLSHLRSGSEYLGLVIYEASDFLHPQLCNGLIMLANTVKRLFSYLEEADKALRHEQEAADRARYMADFREDMSRRLEKIAALSSSLAEKKHCEGQDAVIKELSGMANEALRQTRGHTEDSMDSLK